MRTVRQAEFLLKHEIITQNDLECNFLNFLRLQEATLVHACESRSFEMVKYLVEKGAKITLQAFKGYFSREQLPDIRFDIPDFLFANGLTLNPVCRVMTLFITQDDASILSLLVHQVNGIAYAKYIISKGLDLNLVGAEALRHAVLSSKFLTFLLTEVFA